MLTIADVLLFIGSLILLLFSMWMIGYSCVRKNFVGFVTCWAILLLSVWGLSTFNKKLQNASSAQTKQSLPLTHYFETEEWILVSDFENFDHVSSLYVAEAHSNKDIPSVNKLVYLDTKSCPDLTRIRLKGEKIKVLKIEVRQHNGVIVNNPISVMAFAEPECSTISK